MGPVQLCVETVTNLELKIVMTETPTITMGAHQPAQLSLAVQVAHAMDGFSLGRVDRAQQFVETISYEDPSNVMMAIPTTTMDVPPHVRTNPVLQVVFVMAGLYLGPMHHAHLSVGTPYSEELKLVMMETPMTMTVALRLVKLKLAM